MPASAYAASSAVPATRATEAPVGPPQTANSSVPLSSALGQYGGASTMNGTGPRPTSGTETHRHQSNRYGALQQASSSQVPPSAPFVSSGTKTQNADNPPVDSTRPRDTTSAPRNFPSSHGYPPTSRPNPSTSTVQQTYQRAASVPTQPPLVAQNPPTPRKSLIPFPRPAFRLNHSLLNRRLLNLRVYLHQATSLLQRLHESIRHPSIGRYPTTRSC